MRLDHISYAASHDELVDVVQRLGSRIGSAFIDGGIHPQFGTRNFILPLRNGLYIEVVCPLEHPAADSSPFGKIVSQRSAEGGGWLTWVIATEDIEPIEKRLGRKSTLGHRLKPDGSELRWRQLGVLGTLEDSQLPFFIQWETDNHPSRDKESNSEICAIEFSGNANVVEKWISNSTNSVLEGIQISWINPTDNDGLTGIIAVHVKTPHGTIRLD